MAIEQECSNYLQGGDADQEETYFLYFFAQFLGLDGPYLALLGPLLASLASGLITSTCGIPDLTRTKQIFDQNKAYLTTILR